MSKLFLKRFSLLIAVIVVLSVFAGCNAKNQENPDQTGTEVTNGAGGQETDTAPKEKAVVKVWQRNSGKGGPLHDFLQDFNNSQDEIEAVYEGYGENYFNVVNMALASGSVPEIFEAQNNPPVVTLAEAGHILPVDDMITDDFKKEFHSSSFAQKDFYHDGKLYTIPLRIQHYKLLYNKGLFENAGLDPNRPPQTLEEMRDYASKITQAGKGESYGMGLYINYASIWLRYVDVLSIAHGDTGTYGFDYKTGRFDFGKTRKYFEYWLQYHKDGSLFPGATTLGVEAMRANFAQGKVGMMIDGNWMTTQYATNIQTDVEWEAAPIPLFSGAQRAKDYMTCDITFVIGKDSPNVEAAKKLYKIIVERQGDFRKFGEADTKTYMKANQPEIFDLLPKNLTFRALEEMNNVSNTAAFSVEPQKFLALEGDNRDKAFNNLFALAIDGKADIDKTIEELNKRYNAALDKAVAEGKLTPEELKPAGFDYFNR